MMLRWGEKVWGVPAAACALLAVITGCAWGPNAPAVMPAAQGDRVAKAVAAAADDVAVDANDAAPSQSALSMGPWAQLRMPGKTPTDYRIEGAVSGQSEIHARAQSSASVFRRPVRLPPDALGQLRFEWRVDALMANADLSQPDRADASARVVLAFEGDRDKLPMRDQLAFELAHALTGEWPPYATLMYVWDTGLPVGTVVPGGRSRRIRKIVVASGTEGLGRWQAHQRDIAADFKLAFGEAPGPLVGVGVMTDSDNTHSFAEARYRQIVVRDQSGQSH
jgi:hypothetical protein